MIESNFMIAQMKLVKPFELFQHCLKRKPEQGRLLGLDVGAKYVGLAVSDSRNKIAAPLGVLLRKKTNIEFMVKDFEYLVSEMNLAGFVVGLPIDFQGQPNVEMAQVKLFIEDIQKRGKLEDLRFTYWDERFTSKCVEALLKPLKVHPVQYKTMVDKFAAVGILQGFLDYVPREVVGKDVVERVATEVPKVNDIHQWRRKIAGDIS